MHLEKAAIAVKELLVDTWTLKVILLRAQKEKRARDKTPIFLQKYITNPEQNVGGNTKLKRHSSEVSDRNEEQVIGNRESDTCYKVATWLNCVLVFCRG